MRRRLAGHRQGDRFVLNGGMLMPLWTAAPGRFTRDVDFLRFGASDEEALWIFDLQ